jgi:enoyl-CoA hydratase/carnithine racemase
MGSLVEFEADGPVAVARINRPDRLNALNAEVQSELSAAFARVDREPQIRVLILTGTGRAFCAGADIDELSTRPVEAAAYLESSLAFLSSPERVRKPVIAAVNGYALGGGLELCIACDLVVASDRARFGVPEPKLGVIPGYAVQRLPRLVGVVRAREILLTARQLSAEEALAYGLVGRVVPHDTLLEEARKVAAEVAELAPLAIRVLKEAINRNFHDNDLIFSQRANAWLFATDDAAEGMKAFREKRKPVFREE